MNTQASRRGRSRNALLCVRPSFDYHWQLVVLDECLEHVKSIRAWQYQSMALLKQKDLPVAGLTVIPTWNKSYDVYGYRSLLVRDQETKTDTKPATSTSLIHLETPSENIFHLCIGNDPRFVKLNGMFPKYFLRSPRSLYARAANACKSHQPYSQP